MLLYFFKRLAAAVPILFGIVLVTFLLFHVAGGDPVQVMLGKNARPLEVEQLRKQLGFNRPLFYGHWCKTELFPALEAGSTHLPPEGLTLRRAFDPQPDGRYRLEINAKGAFRLQLPGSGTDFAFASPRRTTHIAEFSGGRCPETLVLVPAGPKPVVLDALHVTVRQENPFSSQFLDALREIADLRRGDDGRLHVQLFNFGTSLATGESVRAVIRAGITPSLVLMGLIFCFETILGIALAMAAAFKRDTAVDRVLMVGSVAGMSISYLVYIIVGQYVLAYQWNLFPVWGFFTPKNLVLPVLVGVVSGLGGGLRYYRTAFLNELYRDHVRTAVAKGCSTLRLLLVHVLPNALIPIITRISVTLPFLFTGSLLLESFFGIPGLGYAGINAIASGDMPVLKALVLAGSVLFIGCNLLADLLCAMVDPRVRLT